MTGDEPLLRVRDLSVRYRVGTGQVPAVRSVSLTVARGETVALVGESGSGKSTTAHAVVGLQAPNAVVAGGEILFGGADLLGLGERRLRAVRGRDIGLIPQDPAVSLNPVKRIGDQVAEVLIVHGMAGRRAAAAEAVEALRRAGLSDPEARARQYPHELSGGMRQRVLIAIAVAARPRLVIADEPTSALDVTVQRRILDHIGLLSRENGMGVLLITHDLGIATDRADRVVVMREGRVVEEGTPGRLLAAPRDPYTRDLLAAAPGLAAAPRPAARATRPARARATGATGDPFADAVPPAAPAGEVLMSVHDLVKEYPLPGGVLRAVDGVSFSVRRGRTYGLVGESGSGKSTTARLLLRLTEPAEGRVVFDGEDVTRLRGRRLRALRRRVQVVYQNPYASLDPRLTVEQIVVDPLASFGLGTRAQRRRRAAELLDTVALPGSLLRRRPAELSGGQRQRVAIARALAVNPELVVCDEPVSALDVSIQAQILDLLAGLQEDLGVGYLFISHDLAVVRQVAHEVGVMRAGRLIEEGETEEVFSRPRHDYTRELLAAIPGHRR
ncbi:ABC transporter ATP-binding protein [Sphaerisporangium krabiense]|uniref:Peptide/nickel transport system ATP-binding protein n=1 Tax=Sphaerisporangium krabiense TaxID=763782 RepID=A0A7W8YZE0_9ACTN|nr:ABC transporter ATP-binding protein [Sphaerisporangium krabiense]MBB5624360.1 peptide/nickel transport system ATP-binding protein [Sphaerisporangium krabiense]GII61687.1 ABC transporter ATP-binding protein [Sphaerisporangium krabiense]